MDWFLMEFLIPYDETELRNLDTFKIQSLEWLNEAERLNEAGDVCNSICFHVSYRCNLNTQV